MSIPQGDNPEAVADKLAVSRFALLDNGTGLEALLSEVREVAATYGAQNQHEELIREIYRERLTIINPDRQRAYNQAAGRLFPLDKLVKLEFVDAHTAVIDDSRTLDCRSPAQSVLMNVLVNARGRNVRMGNQGSKHGFEAREITLNQRFLPEAGAESANDFFNLTMRGHIRRGVALRIQTTRDTTYTLRPNVIVVGDGVDKPRFWAQIDTPDYSSIPAEAEAGEPETETVAASPAPEKHTVPKVPARPPRAAPVPPVRPPLDTRAEQLLKEARMSRERSEQARRLKQWEQDELSPEEQEKVNRLLRQQQSTVPSHVLEDAILVAVRDGFGAVKLPYFVRDYRSPEKRADQRKRFRMALDLAQAKVDTTADTISNVRVLKAFEREIWPSEDKTVK